MYPPPGGAPPSSPVSVTPSEQAQGPLVATPLARPAVSAAVKRPSTQGISRCGLALILCGLVVALAIILIPTTLYVIVPDLLQSAVDEAMLSILSIGLTAGAGGMAVEVSGLVVCKEPPWGTFLRLEQPAELRLSVLNQPNMSYLGTSSFDEAMRIQTLIPFKLRTQLGGTELRAMSQFLLQTQVIKFQAVAVRGLSLALFVGDLRLPTYSVSFQKEVETVSLRRAISGLQLQNVRVQQNPTKVLISADVLLNNTSPFIIKLPPDMIFVLKIAGVPYGNLYCKRGAVQSGFQRIPIVFELFDTAVYPLALQFFSDLSQGPADIMIDTVQALLVDALQQLEVSKL